METIDIQLADIAADDAYAFSYPHLPERWQGVEEKFPGLPLLVIDGQRRVLCGHDYLLLLRQRGTARAGALRLDLPPVECLALNYNVLDRLFGLNLYEKLLFVKKISPLLPDAEVLRRAHLGFPLNDELRRRLDVLLSEPFRLCLAAGRIGLKTALKLAGQPEADRLVQLQVLRSCGFSESQQWQMAQVLEEIAFREKKPIAEVLAAGDLPGLLAGEMPQKKFLDALGELRYPALSRREREWEAWRKKTVPVRGVSVIHAPLFAREEIQVTLTVKDRDAAEKLLGKLKKTLAH